MRILLTGGTGLIGQALCRHWQSQGHTLSVWSRDPQKVAQLCSGAQGVAQLPALDDGPPIDAVVNLAGAPIADRPWTAARRNVLWRSRIDLTHTLVDWMGRQSSPPGILLSASAVGWYGDRGDTLLDEFNPPGNNDFGSRLCMAWEQEAERARSHGVRVACLRIAPVLASKGGMLARLLPVYRLGLGGRLGSGQQWMPWIHLDDLVNLFDHLLHASHASGPFNACSPQATRNISFTRTLAGALHRPALFPVPAWTLRLGLGEMSVLLLGGQRLAPRRTQDSGFIWQYPELSDALEQVLRGSRH
ncbi:TIGR01777 family oxidoreductase [Bordetella avium]|uniref:TIGR01777 family protein n=1 Tax=Bordetella avium (strain 197N) TaxID=360910 RepID=Q2KZJ4_BORA1|nr:TIGR01777 family oxidoreductase [Bordetella avium]AZY49400.1 TIGR01777 family protein [Bordetella avium]AZY52753.1 TIGR01777 family protein [Bordetella avium]RIQ12095.1 TIGR01777 family protein [Bordetella avium]RIQ19086.1 TIGR01777 family protein [Bordetella avium]RIQ31996.1 TIGR01777 family protein [Bordetella avium]